METPIECSKDEIFVEAMQLADVSTAKETQAFLESGVTVRVELEVGTSLIRHGQYDVAGIRLDETTIVLQYGRIKVRIK